VEHESIVEHPLPKVEMKTDGKPFPRSGEAPEYVVI